MVYSNPNLLVFSQPLFIVFFLIVFAIHWSLQGNQARKTWLLAVSYFFYASWDWRFLALIWVSTFVDYVAGQMMARDSVPLSRRFWLIASLVTNLGILGVFKYFDFFATSAARLLTAIGLPTSEPTLALILPIGISFFTFQTLSYTIDVYRRRLDAVDSPLDFALFVAFFPQLVAGPIVRAAEFLPQLREPRRFALIDVRMCLTLFLFGFVKKSCIADHVSQVVDVVFELPGDFDSLTIHLAVLLYAVQIYCDFSGYTDMAIGCAGLLGYRLPRNFDFPYLTGNITVFWSRWHISLSSWLRDYLYIPLGGNRGGRWFTARNLLLTMLLGGLWHGAGWNFVLWGGLHGLALIVHREWQRRSDPDTASVKFVSRLGPLLCFWWVCSLWIFFRARTFSQAIVLTRSWWFFDSPGAGMFPAWWWLLLGVLLVCHLIARRYDQAEWVHQLPDWLFAPLFGAAFATAIAFAARDAEPFIYFQF